MDTSATSIERTDLYLRASKIADEVWLAANRWSVFARDTVGCQLSKAIDSVAANLVEGDGRTYGADSIRFFVYSRASAREARHWIRRAIARRIVPEEKGLIWIDELTEIVKMIHALIRYRTSRLSIARETVSTYDADPFVNSDLDLLGPSSLVPSS